MTEYKLRELVVYVNNYRNCKLLVLKHMTFVFLCERKHFGIKTGRPFLPEITLNVLISVTNRIFFTESRLTINALPNKWLLSLLCFFHFPNR